MALTREAILARAKRDVEEVEIPDIGDTVYLRRITIGERNEWAARRWRAVDMDSGKLTDVKLWADSRVYLAACSLCDEDGNSLFSEAEAAALDPHTVDAIADAAERVNGLTTEAAEDIQGN